MVKTDGYGLGRANQRGGADRVGEEEFGRGGKRFCAVPSAVALHQMRDARPYPCTKQR